MSTTVFCWLKGYYSLWPDGYYHSEVAEQKYGWWGGGGGAGVRGNNAADYPHAKHGKVFFTYFL